MIDRVNQVLLDGRNSEEYMSGLLYWYSGRDRKRLANTYRQLFSGQD